MKKNIVIVESPTKTKAIEKYLGNSYKAYRSTSFEIEAYCQ